MRKCSYLGQHLADGLRRQAHVLRVFGRVWQKQHEPEPLHSGPRRHNAMTLSDCPFALRLHRRYAVEFLTGRAGDLGFTARSSAILG
jgi:hypothetical protein